MAQLILALSYLEFGFSVIPLSGIRKPTIPWKDYQQQLPTEEEIKSWFSKPGRNIGIVTGRISNLVVLDIDGEEGEATLRNRCWHIPPTPSVKTPHGYHYYFSYPPGQEIRCFVRKDLGIDLRAEGGYAAAPPSILLDGEQYRWVVSLEDSSLAAMPDWLLHLCDSKNEHEPRVGVNLPMILAGVPEGERDDSLFRYACRLREQGLCYEEAIVIVLEMAKRCEPPFPERRAIEKVESAFRYPGPSLVPLEDYQVATLNSFNPTDAGQGEAIAHLYGDQLRYDHTRNRWLIWDSPRWRVDFNGEAKRYALLTARQRLRAATAVEDETKRKVMGGWSLNSESEYRVHSALKMASITEQLSISSEQMDQDPWLLGCANDVVNLKTQELRNGNQNDLISLSTNVDFMPDAIYPRWERFLEEVFGDNDLICFVQRAVGYSLTGSTAEQCLFFCFGTGANGKSTFLNILRYILGEYARNTQFETFQESKGDRPSNDLASLRGVRLVTASEVRDGVKLNEGRIKSLTGEDPITCRFLFGEFFTYQPTMKIWIAANHKPVIRGTDEAIWRRIYLIPFLAYFPKDKADMGLIKELEAEAPGILAWAVRGCSEWQKQGLRPPTAVLMATQGYRQEMDLLEQFLDECIERGPMLEVQAGRLYEAYRSWSERNGESTMSGTTFGRRLKEKGFEKTKSTYTVYRGLGLKSNT